MNKKYVPRNIALLKTDWEKLQIIAQYKGYDTAASFLRIEAIKPLIALNMDIVRRYNAEKEEQG